MADSGDAYLRTLTHNLFTKPVFTALEDCRAQGEAASCQMFAREDNLLHAVPITAAQAQALRLVCPGYDPREIAKLLNHVRKPD